MKPTPRSLCGLLLAVSLAGTLARATDVPPQGVIKHVIIVIQENRTPDNLFYLDSTLVANGGNVRPPGNPPYGLCKPIINNTPPDTFQIPLTALQLDPCFDPRHRHIDWTRSYDSGLMDGACNVELAIPSGCQLPPCPVPLPSSQPCPEYSYVSFPVSIATYFDIAHKYGFANYMFTTHQGPSLPGHQFLFGGTSLPYPYPDSRYRWFAADNVVFGGRDKLGCIAQPSAKVNLIGTDGIWPDCKDTPGDSRCIYPCLDHKTLVDVFGSTVSWKYYTDRGGSLWDAPAAVLSVCGPDQPPPNGTECRGSAYTDHVVLPAGDKARILNDIKTNCDLKNVSWVIPDGKWSDHAGQLQGHPEIVRDGGPSWVGHIINAVGTSPCTDRIGDRDVPYWEDTVILVTWDDWGGWYDHVSPVFPSGPGIGYPNLDSTWYVYGFRVPLLVISAYNKHTTGVPGYSGYISGPLNDHTCDHTNYCHDFGSILNFIEFTFGSGGRYLEKIGDTDPNPTYADAQAPDSPDVCGQACPYSLSDFFRFDLPANDFTPITSIKYPEKCFHQPDQTGCWPNSVDEDPDDDAFED